MPFLCFILLTICDIFLFFIFSCLMEFHAAGGLVRLFATSYLHDGVYLLLHFFLFILLNDHLHILLTYH